MCVLKKLLRGADSWSLSELVHAIVILAHFHALSSFVHGCGLTPEISHVDGHTYGGGSALAAEQHALIAKKSSIDELTADGFGVSELLFGCLRKTGIYVFMFCFFKLRNV